MVITGPNGGGKTTLARIIAGIESPESGRIFLDQEEITSLDVTQRALKGISFAFQQPVRFKGITVRQLIETAAGSKVDSGELWDILGNVVDVYKRQGISIMLCSVFIDCIIKRSRSMLYIFKGYIFHQNLNLTAFLLAFGFIIVRSI